MKIRNLILSIPFILASFSCSSSDMIDEGVKNDTQVNNYVEQQIELSNINSQISALNENMFYANQPETRGLKKWFKKFIAIVVSDAVGGLFGNLYGGACGAICGAVTASAAAAFIPADNITVGKAPKSIERVKIPSPTMNSANVALSQTILPEKSASGGELQKIDSIGYYHNYIMLSIQPLEEAELVSVDDIIDNVSDLSAKEYGEQKQTLVDNLQANRSLFDNIIEKKMYSSEEYPDLHELMNEWKEMYPDQTDCLSVLETFFEGISNMEVEENDGEYLNKVLNIIENSSLSEEIRMNLRNAFIVGNASYQLWNTEE